jgi:hypothetical protein
MIKYCDIASKLYSRLNIGIEIQKLIYDNFDDQKFIYDKVTKTQKLSTEYLR